MEIIGNLLSLERAIPDSVAAGVLSGQYTVHGGVIRNASGQIVRHLVPAVTQKLDPFGLISTPFSLFNTYQLHRVAEITQQLMVIGTATMAMAGLNLAVSAVGFKVLHRGLRQVQDRVEKLNKNVAWIKTFLDSGRRAILLNAADQLSSLPGDSYHRNQILHSARHDLGKVGMHYLQHWDESTELLEAMAYQHYFSLALLMKVRCSAELEMYDNVQIEFENGLRAWRERGREIAGKRILKDRPSRFLDREYANDIPVAKIAGWMDFAHGETRGFDWIDVLRKEHAPGGIDFYGRFKAAKVKEDMEVVNYMDNLVSRDRVLDGYQSQYDFLAANRIKPSEFERELKQLSKEHPDDEMFVLAPSTRRLMNFF